ncbi:MAG: hypothetical protein KF744_12040 [Taibaiella sp.]|nr:hypothetical protein [Taibaiella sp.]
MTFAAVDGIAQSQLEPFRVIFRSGDDLSEYNEINIYRKDGKYYAANLAPTFYIGAQAISSWTTELNAEKINTCIKFLKRARALPEECPVASPVPKEYKIISASDSFTISGDCDWEDLDFLFLRGILFYENFAKMEQERAAIRKDLNKQLFGTWYFTPFSRMPEKGEQITLVRAPGAGQTCKWEFGESNSFKSSCNEILNQAFSVKYLLNMDGGHTMEIQGGTTTDKDGNSHVRNYGSTWSIESISPSELKLRYMWR